jgi:DNA-binding HxlR family transcriptional regulator
LGLIGGKWKGVILYHLMDGKKRFGELRKFMPSVTQRMLTKQLRELESDGLIHRKIYKVVPPKVEYSLTEKASPLKPIIVALEQWGKTLSGETFD